ncbi:MAG: hypothetical protein AAGA77_02330 [Bacteroidota bacterium]
MKIVLIALCSVIISVLSSIAASWLEPSLKRSKRIVLAVFIFVFILSILLSIPSPKDTTINQSTSQNKIPVETNDSIYLPKNNLGILEDYRFSLNKPYTDLYLSQGKKLYNDLTEKLSNGNFASDTLYYANTPEIKNGKLRIWNAKNTIGAGTIINGKFKEMYISYETNSNGTVKYCSLWFRKTADSKHSFPRERVEFNYLDLGKIDGYIYSSTKNKTEMTKNMILDKIDNEVHLWTRMLQNK